MCRPHIASLGLALLLVLGLGRGAGTALADPCVAESGTLAERLDRHLTPDQKGDLAFLLHLGWRVTQDHEVKAVEVRGGTPCRRADLAAAHAAGDLEIRFPPGPTASEIRRFGSALPGLTDSIASRCAYQLRLAVATETATEKLARSADRGPYGFPYLFGFTFPIFQCKPPRPEWVEVDIGKLWQARDSAAEAIESVYSKTSVVECYVAQWIAAYASQYELYGRDWFDTAFKPEEIAVGTSRAVRTTRFGHYMKVEIDHPYTALVIPPSDQKTDLYKVLGERGYQSFAGVCGIIQTQIFALDAFENFMIVSISPKAAEKLRTGGFRYMEKQAKTIWELDERRKQLFTSRKRKAELQAQIDKLFADPVFSEFVLYIHPYGVHTLEAAGRKKLKRGSTPITVGLYPNGREDAFYKHYRASWKQRFLAQPPGAPATER